MGLLLLFKTNNKVGRGREGEGYKIAFIGAVSGLKLAMESAWTARVVVKAAPFNRGTWSKKNVFVLGNVAEWVT